MAIGRALDRVATNHDIMHALGIVREPTISEYRRDGLSIWQADRFAIAINKHPIEVWGVEMWIATVDTGDDEDDETEP